MTAATRADDLQIDSIGIIGAGRLGGSLVAALQAAGYPVRAVGSRNPDSAARVAGRASPGPEVLLPQQVVSWCDLIFLAVPDTAIEELAASLPWRPGMAAVHTSGATDLQVLAGASSAGVHAGCWHPLQSFPSAEGSVARFHGIVCGIEALPPLRDYLERMPADLGATPVGLEGVDRALYHAAAVLVSNDAVALMAAASRSWAAAGLPAELAREALAPLLRGAAASIAARDLPEALTGPVARGDVGTVALHLAAFDRANLTELAALYRLLGLELLRLPLTLDSGTSQHLRALFESAGDRG